MKNIIANILLLGAARLLFAQQSVQYSQYMVNPYLMNPALSSVEDMIDIKTGYRSQWLGFNQVDVAENNTGYTSESGIHPQTYYLTAHTPINKPHAKMHYVSEAVSWFGLGAKLLKDKTGPSSWSNYMISGTYNTGIIAPKGSGKNKYGGLRMSAGMFFGVQEYRLDWTKLEFGNNDGEPLRNVNSGVVSKYMPDASVGVWFYNESFYLGASADHVFGNRIDLPLPNEMRTENSFLARHYFITSGYNQKVSEQLVWSPSVLLKYTLNAPVAFDLNNKIIYEGKYWGGISYRHLDALSLSVGSVLNEKFEFAYSYDYTVSSIRTLGNVYATHEITLGYRILPVYREMIAEEHQHQHEGHHMGKKHKRYRQ